MKHLKVRIKLTIGFALVSALTFIIGIVGIINFTRIGDSYTYSINTHGKPLGDIAEALIDLQKTRYEVRGLLLYTGNLEEIEKIEDSIQKSLSNFETIMEEYVNTIVRDDTRECYNRAMRTYKEVYKPACLMAITDTKLGKAQGELIEQLQFAKGKSNEIFDELIQTMHAKCTMLEKTKDDSDTLVRSVHVTFLVLSIAAVVFSALLGHYIANLICKPLAILTVFMKKASTEGDLSLTPEEQKNIAKFSMLNDEIGQTIASCAAFIERVTAADRAWGTVANGNLTPKLPLLSDKDTIGQSLQKVTSRLNSMKENVEDLLRETRAADHTKEEFMSRMSHEMLTPMNGIIGLLQVIKQISGNEQIKEYLDIMDNVSHQLLQLITNVLDLSNSPGSSIHKLEPSVFSFNAMFDDLQKIVRPMVQAKNQTFTYHIDPFIPSSLSGHPDHLTKVIGHLLGNAVKFTPGYGEIRFAANVLERDQKNITLQIEVADNGIGIAEAQQSKIFELFEQLDGGNTRKYQGTGLGLALAKRIIESMGGKINVDSELGKGAKFTFTCKVHEPA